MKDASNYVQKIDWLQDSVQSRPTANALENGRARRRSIHSAIPTERRKTFGDPNVAKSVMITAFSQIL
jgi:hypothetical protein